MTDDLSPLQVHGDLREADPSAADLFMADFLIDRFPEDPSHLHLCVYGLLLKFPELMAIDAMEMLYKIGLLLDPLGGKTE